MVKKGTKCLSFVVIQKDSEDSDEIVREYDDVEWLQHCLMTEDGVVGCIVSLHRSAKHLLQIMYE